jgi:hypothetical protein
MHRVNTVSQRIVMHSLESNWYWNPAIQLPLYSGLYALVCSGHPFSMFLPVSMHPFDRRHGQLKAAWCIPYDVPTATHPAHKCNVAYRYGGDAGNSFHSRDCLRELGYCYIITSVLIQPQVACNYGSRPT